MTAEHTCSTCANGTEHANWTAATGPATACGTVPCLPNSLGPGGGHTVCTCVPEVNGTNGSTVCTCTAECACDEENGYEGYVWWAGQNNSYYGGCNPKVCEADFRVQAHYCVACPAHAAAAAGGLAHLQDTPVSVQHRGPFSAIR